MQIFVPYRDLNASVSCLDPSRLGNQIFRECLTLLEGGWPNHPASKMWYSYPDAIRQYCLYGIDELERREGPSYKLLGWKRRYQLQGPCILPHWFGNLRVHNSHKAALLYKNYEWYSQFGWKTAPAVPRNGRLPYVWINR